MSDGVGEFLCILSIPSSHLLNKRADQSNNSDILRTAGGRNVQHGLVYCLMHSLTYLKLLNISDLMFVFCTTFAEYYVQFEQLEVFKSIIKAALCCSAFNFVIQK